MSFNIATKYSREAIGTNDVRSELFSCVRLTERSESATGYIIFMK
jgi:hypothetical protein